MPKLGSHNQGCMAGLLQGVDRPFVKTCKSSWTMSEELMELSIET